MMTLANPTPDRDALRAARFVTRRLVLRPLQPSDAPAIAALADNLKVAAMTARMPHPYGLADAEAFLAALDRREDVLARAVTLVADGRLIGCCGVEAGITGEGDDAPPELGYWIGEPYWGQGYATEAVGALIESSFDLLDAEALVAACRPVNAGSRSVLKKCGFRYTGAGSIASTALGAEVEIERYRLDRQAWLVQRSRLARAAADQEHVL